MPSKAAATARKAKWYHIVTLKIRVRRISYMSVAPAIAKTPPSVAARRASGPAVGGRRFIGGPAR